MKKQDLQQIIEDLNQLVNSAEGNYVMEHDILKAIHNDRFKTHMLDILARNNASYTLCRISDDIMDLAHRIYEYDDYDDFEKKYLDKTLRALDGFKAEIHRIQEYINLLRQIKTLENSTAKYKASILEGADMHNYECSLNNISN